ncbi:SCO family protein [Parapusillimonas granuli]|uniref:SCO family protein n=1 Tax=Parapusillimonas granuli TaxID=380911 RepID=A0A853FTF2_9BURK|nr:SCO family protein [Parapusillimonas granuli]MBB5216206.1 protein SCO1/2 [Parapusillimonas granuli]MEB2400481.1 SCO family protein [Alcaligenaceae bacterium]NYT47883.1 SCO family protein [Parapusillimonas granuli]
MFAFSTKRRALVGLAAATALAPVLSACGKKEVSFLGSDITGTKLGREMAVKDASGAVRTLADYKGKVCVVFFGYTQCPDICPTSMAELSQVMELLGKDADKVQVLMISVDPDRDTPEILSAYVQAFHPSFIGLTGTPEQVATTAKSFKAFYAKAAGPTPGQYTMDHASSFYIIDKQGEARVLVSGKAGAEDIASDIRQLL